MLYLFLSSVWLLIVNLSPSNFLMYSAERRQQILELVEKDARVSVAELACQFDVSRASIRRDLNYLYSSGLLERTYGGALRNSEKNGEAPFAERRVAQLDEKEKIGKAAAQFVPEGGTIFMDGGTTTECIVPYLQTKTPLTVVTYGLNVVNRLVSNEQITVIAIGGTLHRRSQTFNGILALDMLQAHNLHFDVAFIAASGVSAEAGVTNASLEEISIKRYAVAAAQQTILLVDSSKVGVIATGRIVPIEKVHRLVTSNKAPKHELDALRLRGVEIELVA